MKVTALEVHNEPNQPPMMNFARRLILSFATIISLTPGPLRATWYQEKVANGSDIIMMDLRWPWWPSGTYYANWNTSFNPRPNNGSFYAGFLGSVPDGPGFTPNPDEKLQAAFRPGSVWSFWGSGGDGTPVRFTDVAPNLYIKNDYGGEGCSGTLGADPWPFVTCKQWYTDSGNFIQRQQRNYRDAIGRQGCQAVAAAFRLLPQGRRMAESGHHQPERHAVCGSECHPRGRS